MHVMFHTVMASCQCEKCHQKRNLFTQCLHDMTGGMGRTKKKILKNINIMPENFLHDLRQLLRQLRQSPNAKLTPQQQSILQAHRLPLRRFTVHDPRLLLATKRRVNGKLIPLAQAIALLLINNPKLMENYVNSIEAH